VATIIQEQHRGNHDRNQRWARFERADLFARHVEEAIVVYQREETTRLAQEMPPKETTATQDETFTGCLCLVAIEPVSNYILLEHTAEARDHDPWNALMEDALAWLNCKVIQSTRDEAPGLLAYVEHRARGRDPDHDTGRGAACAG